MISKTKTKNQQSVTNKGATCGSLSNSNFVANCSLQKQAFNVPPFSPESIDDDNALRQRDHRTTAHFAIRPSKGPLLSPHSTACAGRAAVLRHLPRSISIRKTSEEREMRKDSLHRTEDT